MVLQESSPSKHNVMVGTRIPHPKSTKYDDGGDDDFATPPPKRIKRDITDFVTKKESPQKSAKRSRKDEVPDSDDGSDNEILHDEASTGDKRTDLETALPAIQSDKEAIEAYEASRAAGELGLQGRLAESKWERGKSSIYVDAFNLALETVLEDEGHLFDEAEHAVFKQWRDFNYEAQYLYVRLFLRKTSSWHRINRLGYHSDIADLPQAVIDLQVARDSPSTSTTAQDNAGELDPPADTFLGEQFAFADRSEDCIKDLEEASSLLLLDELKAIAKDARVQGKNKKDLLRALRRASGKQTGLGFAGLKRSETEESSTSTGSGLEEEGSRDVTPSRGENRDSDGDWTMHSTLPTDPEAFRARASRLLPQHRMDREIAHNHHPCTYREMEFSTIHCEQEWKHLCFSLTTIRVRGVHTNTVSRRQCA
jgi:Fanconi-associated nuclease 1